MVSFYQQNKPALQATSDKRQETSEKRERENTRTHPSPKRRPIHCRPGPLERTRERFGYIVLFDFAFLDIPLVSIVMAADDDASLIVREAKEEDAQDIAEIIMRVAARGDTYSLPRDITRDQALDYWYTRNNRVFVACNTTTGQVVGTYVNLIASFHTSSHDLMYHYRHHDVALQFELFSSFSSFPDIYCARIRYPAVLDATFRTAATWCSTRAEKRESVAKCVSTVLKRPDARVFSPCSSTSSCRRTRMLFTCGKLWGS